MIADKKSTGSRSAGLEVRPDIASEFAGLLGVQTASGRQVNVAELIRSLTERFEPEFARLLSRRREFLASVAAGKARYAFADPEEVIEDADGNTSTVAKIRQGMLDGFFGRETPERWRLNAGVHVPAEAVRPGLQGTGPCDDLGMAMSALNAGGYGAASWMWDWEDAGNDYRDKLYRAWSNLKQLLHGEWEGKNYRHPDKKKDYAIKLRVRAGRRSSTACRASTCATAR